MECGNRVVAVFICIREREQNECELGCQGLLQRSAFIRRKHRYIEGDAHSEHIKCTRTKRAVSNVNAQE